MDALTAALKVYLGLPGSPWPRARSSEVVRDYGEPIAAQVQLLISEAGGLEIDWQSHSPLSAMRWIEAEMRDRHPELSGEAITDLGWAWSYWNK